MDSSNEISLERRLTTIEGKIDQLGEKFDGHTQREDVRVGHVEGRLDLTDVWRTTHDVAHAESRGVTAGRLQLRTELSTRDKLFFTAVVAVLGVAVPIVVRLLE